MVGLVCIRIFGYSDARAEKLAEETGIAFQLTNILRDVKEDAERGRMYICRSRMMVRFERERGAVATGAAQGRREIERNGAGDAARWKASGRGSTTPRRRS